MKRWFAAFALLIAAGVQAQAADWVIVPGKRAGPIGADASEAGLIERYGAANVTRATLDIEPGQAIPATVVFAHDPRRKAIVLWRDPGARTAPERVIVRDAGTRWKTDRGITIGTSLATLRRMNGRRLTLTGFAWDFGGTVLDSHGGALAELGSQGPQGIEGRTLVLRLDPDPKLRQTAAYRNATGERDFSSDSAPMRQLNPRVYELSVELVPK